MPTGPLPPLLEVRRIFKSFGGVTALRDVSLSLGGGEILAVVGENGAGKTTLMRIAAGVETPDAGEILSDGQAVTVGSIGQAIRLGICLIHQELNLAENLSIAANIYLGREPTRLGLVDQQTILRESQKLLTLVGLEASPHELVGSLSIGQQQLVEIAKALSTDARLIIMDEPTSALSEHEARRLFDVVRLLQGRGVSVLYISHRLREVEELADRVVVLRDGQVAGELQRHDIDRKAIVRLMIGRDVSQLFRRTPHSPRQEVLSVDALCTAAFPWHPLTFSLRAGEIVGIAGLVGAGRSEVLTTLFGVTPAVAGTMTSGPLQHPPATPREAISAGIMLVPEDRRRTGVILAMSVKSNLTLASLQRDQTRGFVNGVAETRVADSMIDQLRIKAAHLSEPVQNLSGGNQQKVVLGKWLCLQPRLLLLDEPTRGIDVGAKEEIYKLIDRLAGEGVGVLFASSEMDEILGLSDRVIVMHEGRITGELSRAELSEEAVMRLATGDSSPMLEEASARQ